MNVLRVELKGTRNPLTFSLQRLRPANQQRSWRVNAVRAMHMIMVVALRGHIEGNTVGSRRHTGDVAGGDPSYSVGTRLWSLEGSADT